MKNLVFLAAVIACLSSCASVPGKQKFGRIKDETLIVTNGYTRAEIDQKISFAGGDGVAGIVTNIVTNVVSATYIEGLGISGGHGVLYSESYSNFWKVAITNITVQRQTNPTGSRSAVITELFNVHTSGSDYWWAEELKGIVDGSSFTAFDVALTGSVSAASLTLNSQRITVAINGSTVRYMLPETDGFAVYATVTNKIPCGAKVDTSPVLDSRRLVTSDGVYKSVVNKYEKPSGGIASNDLSSSVRQSLTKADTAYQLPLNGIPETDLSQNVRDKIDTAANLTNEVTVIYGKNRTSSVDGDKNLYDVYPYMYTNSIGSSLKCSWKENGDKCWLGYQNNTPDTPIIEAYWLSNTTWKVKRISDGRIWIRENVGQEDAQSINLGLSWDDLVRIANTAFVLHGHIVPSYRKINGIPLTNDVTIASGADTNVVNDLIRSYDQTNLTARINAKQNTLVSGTNIKTINNNTIVGSGNLNLTGEDIKLSSSPTSASIYYGLVNAVSQMQPKWSANSSYSEGMSLIANGGFYRALTDIAADPNNSPPESDTNRWELCGQYLIKGGNGVIVNSVFEFYEADYNFDPIFAKKVPQTDEVVTTYWDGECTRPAGWITREFGANFSGEIGGLAVDDIQLVEGQRTSYLTVDTSGIDVGGKADRVNAVFTNYITIVNGGVNASYDINSLRVNTTEATADKVLSKHDVSIGLGVNRDRSNQNISGEGSFAAGTNTFSRAVYSVALGQWAEATNDAAFVWSGDHAYVGSRNYGSRGDGTFNVNPENGIDGFFIGDSSLRDVVNGVVPILDKQDKLPYPTNAIPATVITNATWATETEVTNVVISASVTNAGAVAEAKAYAEGKFVYKEPSTERLYIGNEMLTATNIGALGCDEQAVSAQFVDWTGVQDTPTTIAGYGITDAFEAQAATNAAEAVFVKDFAANADYVLTNLTDGAFWLASGEIGNYETTTNLTLRLDFSDEANRSGDCLLFLVNADDAEEHTITVAPTSLDVRGIGDGYLTAAKATTNLFMFSRVKANTIVVSKQELK